MSEKLCACGCGLAVPEKSTYRLGHHWKVKRGGVEILPPNPSGICQCGCGLPAPLATVTAMQRGGSIAGQPLRFIASHGATIHRKLEGSNPSGLCLCGCGQKTKLSDCTDKNTGAVFGKPQRFIHNHHARGDRNPNYRTPAQKEVALIAAKRRDRANKMKLCFHLTAEGFDKMMEEQGHLCAMCGEPFGDKGLRPVIDHDHNCCSGKKTCGKCLRGIIHHGCNVAIGLFKDDPSALRVAADYLEKHLLLKSVVGEVKDGSAAVAALP